MKIAAIDTYSLVLPVKEIYGGAAGFLEDCRSLIVRVETENGIEGWGEATQGRPGNTYETLETMDDHGAKIFCAGAHRHGSRRDRVRSSASFMAFAMAIRLPKRPSKSRSSTLWENLIDVPLCRFFGGPYRREIELVGGLGMDLGPEAIGGARSPTQARRLSHL